MAQDQAKEQEMTPPSHISPWDAVEAARDSAYQVGGYWISRIEYDTLQGEHRIRLWIENLEGEGTETGLDTIPEGVTPEWMDDFWRVSI